MGGNPLQKLTNWTSGDTVRSLTGRETSVEKRAKAEQEASLMEAKTEADTALDIRKKRIEKKAQGRGSLLTGTELGLSSTLG
jgi:hypothetical protein